MTEPVQGKRQRAKFRKWLNLVRPETRQLGLAVEAELARHLEQLGFARVDAAFHDAAWIVSGSEILLEKQRDEWVDAIEFRFEKYGSPRFQVHAARRRAVPPHELAASCNLVAKPGQYYHFWGKPWWLPTRLWRTAKVAHTVAAVRVRLPQLLAFLESGARGSGISRSWRSAGSPSMRSEPVIR